MIVTSHSIAWTRNFSGTWAGLTARARCLSGGEVPANVVNKEVLAGPAFLRKASGL